MSCFVILSEHCVQTGALCHVDGFPARRLLRLLRPCDALDLDACKRFGIEHVKRVTGGGTVLQTPDVFNYSYTAPNTGVLDLGRVFELGNQLVIRGLHELGIEARHCGISDVVVGDRKISGNAQARKWRSILLHGTVMVDIDHNLMKAVLLHPAKEPDYRQGRSHSDFITTIRELGVDAAHSQIEDAFRTASKDMLRI